MISVTEDSDRTLVAFVGDSLVQGGRWREWLPEYRCESLGVADGAGIGVEGRLEEIIALAPQAVVLVIGSHNATSRHSVEPLVRSIENTLHQLRQALPEARILVHSLVPGAAEFSPFIREINRHLWQFAPNVRAQYLDLWPVLVRGDAIDPAYRGGRFPLTSAGYRAWLAELKPALERLLSLPLTSRPILLTVPRPS